MSPFLLLILPPLSWDGSYICARTNDGVANIARHIHPNYPCLKRSPYDLPPGANPSGGTGLDLDIGAAHGHVVFGGIHPGICMFAIGDGSVRSIPITISWEALYWLSNVNDGNAESIP